MPASSATPRIRRKKVRSSGQADGRGPVGGRRLRERRGVRGARPRSAARRRSSSATATWKCRLSYDQPEHVAATTDSRVGSVVKAGAAAVVVGTAAVGHRAWSPPRRPRLRRRASSGGISEAAHDLKDKIKDRLAPSRRRPASIGPKMAAAGAEGRGQGSPRRRRRLQQVATRPQGQDQGPPHAHRAAAGLSPRRRRG